MTLGSKSHTVNTVRVSDQTTDTEQRLNNTAQHNGLLITRENIDIASYCVDMASWMGLTTKIKNKNFRNKNVKKKKNVHTYTVKKNSYHKTGTGC